MRASIIAAVAIAACTATEPTNGLCTSDDQNGGVCGPGGVGGGGGGGGGTGGGQGGGVGTYEQLCEQDARNQCANIGYAGNDYCFMVWSQDCSDANQADAIAFCLAHLYIPHDAQCHPLWV